MFFRRAQPKQLTAEERLQQIREAGFILEPLGGSQRVRITRNGCAAVLEFVDDVPRVVERPGLVMGSEIGALTDGGYQKFFLTPGGKRKPALAADLRALHDFEEDLRESLGQISLYNESLGTVSTFYLYDRVKDRDHGVPKRAWE
ncbi:MAG TPA: hypothetical protein VLX58_17730 [Bryobacteraceae bacterium]|nr:hypothetical protein [Bryobacteraceae bacterium]HUJ23380.1 hypothetical protein [Bryobacteraceae bacterium]